QGRLSTHLAIVLLVKHQPNRIVDISPNAMKGSFRVRYPRMAQHGEVRADLLDAGGNVMDVNIDIDVTRGESMDITIANTSSGIYYLKIFDGKTCVIKKIILQ
ncbi:MAG: T9SS type A sorting domain-containing protein, partial [Saprospiraceae bacterium]|nr:T9SS type A sorting domain-containing protein [Saprospiraceae bacterium]